MDSVPQKRCKDCGELFPISDYFFYRDKHRKDGFVSRCKDCYSKKVGYSYRKKARVDGLKHCSQCETDYPATTDYFHKRQHGLHSWCIECEKRYSRHQYEKHKDRIVLYANQPKVKARALDYSRSEKAKIKRREYQKRPEVIERRRKRDRKRAYDPRRREYTRMMDRKRYRENETYKATLRIAGHNRRTQQRNLPSTMSVKDWQRCLEYWNGCCCICGRSADFWHFIAKEHWIAVTDPRSDNPGTVNVNIVPMCHSKKGSLVDDIGCNNSKANKDPIDWLNKRFGNRKAKEIYRRIEAYFEWIGTQA